MGKPGAYFAGMKNAGGLCGHDGGGRPPARVEGAPPDFQFSYGAGLQKRAPTVRRPAYSMESEPNAVPADASAPKKKRPRR